MVESSPLIKLFRDLIKPFYLISAVGMDPTNPTLVGKSSIRQLIGRCPEEAGGVPGVPPQAQTTTCRTKSQIGKHSIPDTLLAR